MTISSTIRKAGPFTGDGAVTVFPFTFKVFSAADLLVVQTASGIEVAKTLASDYTVALNANQNSTPGGALTMMVAPSAGSTLTFTSAMASLQSLDVTNGGGFYPAVLNNAFDKATILIQQLAEKVGRSLQLPLSSTASAALPAPVAARLLAWNAAGTAIENVDASGFASLIQFGSSGVQVFTTAGSTTSFTLTKAPGGVNNTQVYSNGVYQEKGTYTVFGALLTFAKAPPAGNVEVVTIGVLPLGATTADLITYTPLGTGAVARNLQAKLREAVSVKDFGALADGSDDAGKFTLAAAACKAVNVYSGAYTLATTPTIGSSVVEVYPGATLSGAGAAAIGCQATSAYRQTLQVNSAPNQFATQYVRRNANHTGGTPGFTSAAFRADTFVGAGVANYEWAIIGVCTSSAAAGENVGGYFQGNALSTGGVWGGVMEACDMTYTASAGKTVLVGAEIDCYCNDVDSGTNRIGLQVVAGDAKFNRTGVAGVTGEATYGILVLPQTGGAGGKFKNGVVVQTATDTAFQTSATGATAFRNLGNVGVGFDTSQGVVNQAAFKMASGQNIAFDANATNQLGNDGSGLAYQVSGVKKSRLNASGGVELNNLRTVVTGSFSSGATTATLGANKPGAGTTPTQWLSVTIDGAQGWIPWFAN